MIRDNGTSVLLDQTHDWRGFWPGACCRLPLLFILVTRAFAEIIWNVRMVGLLVDQLSFINLHRAHEYTPEWGRVHMPEVCTVAHLISARSMRRRKEHRPCNKSIPAVPRACAQRHLCRHPEQGRHRGIGNYLETTGIGLTVARPVRNASGPLSRRLGQSKMYNIR